MNTLKCYLCGIVILLLGTHLNAQNATSIKFFFEKVYLHTDREQYAAGEDIWFKAYLVDAQNNQLIDGSNTLYVELINTDNAITDRKLIRLDKGLGNADIKLDEKLITGTYRIRAYTNWMRNFSDYFVFEKRITVINSTPLPASVVSMVSEKPAVTSAKTVDEKPLNAVNIRFFPEGGSLVDNVRTQVAFKAEDNYGRGIAVSGDISASSGRIVAKFNCDSTGMGVFSLRPDESQRYRSVFMKNGVRYESPLPKVLHTGFVLSINQVDSAIVTSISCNGFSLTGYAGQRIVIVGRHGGKTCYKNQLEVSASTLLLQIPDRGFPEGIACITLYDEHNVPLAERLVYVHHPDKVAPLIITTDKQSYQPREKVTVTIKTATPNASLSMSVFDAGIIPMPEQDIQSYLLLKSEVRGNIEHAKSYFDTSNVNRFKQLDLLLMTQGWRDYTWRRIADSALKATYQLEKGISISGKVKEIWSGKPSPHLNITLFANNATGTKVFTARTDEKGKFDIDGINMAGNQNISLNAVNDKGKRSAWITVDTTTIIRYPVKKLIIAPDTGNYLKYSAAMDTRAKISRKVNLADTQRLKEVQITALPIGKTYGDAVIQVVKDDYKLETLGLYYTQKIQPVIWAQMDKTKIKGLPWGLVITTSDTLKAWNYWRIQFFKLPMDKIISVRYRLIRMDGQPSFTDQQKGWSPRPGYFIWLDLKVKPHAFDDFDFHVTNLDVDGYYQAREFYQPKYETPSARADVRTTILWQPNITTGAKGEATITYYNADPKTSVAIQVEGVKNTGGVLVGSASYAVK